MARIENALRLAVDQTNKAGGVTLTGKQYQLDLKVVVVPANDDAAAVTAVTSIIADPLALAIVGPIQDNTARAIMPALNKAGLANISFATTDPALTLPAYGELDKLRPTGQVTYFRLAATADREGLSAGGYAFDKLGKRKAYILDDTEVYGKGLADQFAKEFQARGGQVLDHKSVPKGTTDFSSILASIAASGADVLYYGSGPATDLSLARKQMTVAGLNIPFVGGDAVVNDPFLQQAGGYGTLPVANALALADTLPEAKQFLTAYQTGFGTPGPYSAAAYDAANIVIAAITHAGTADRAAVRKALAATADYRGATGETSFDSNGDRTKPWVSFYEIKSGQFNLLIQAPIPLNK